MRFPGTCFLAAVFGAFAAGGCGRGPEATSQKQSAPVTVKNAVPESALATITLSAQAESRLGIRLGAVEHKKVARIRTLAGEVVVPPGRSVTVSAPVAGTVAAAGAGEAPVQPGATLAKGQAVFRLLPLLPAERDLRGRAEREVEVAGARLEAARLKVNRAERLLRDQAGSARALEEARVEMAVAEAGAKAARSQLARLEKAPLEADVGVAIVSPESGMLRQVHAGIGQAVAAGAALFEVADLRSLWVRVPIYVGDLARIETRSAARIHDLGDPARLVARMAKPVAAPPSADPKSDSVDLFFELPDGPPFRPGQKLGVTLNLREAEQGLVVPWPAILHDAYGGAWVYENSAPHTYVRRRVDVRHVVGDLAVLSHGPAAGTKVVIEGAAEIFGAEFTGK